MMNFSATKTVTISEEYLRDTCLDAISDFMYNEYDIDIVNNVSANDRRLIYAKVGAMLIDFAGSNAIV